MSFKISKDSLLALLLVVIEIGMLWFIPTTRQESFYLAQSDSYKNEPLGEILNGMKIEYEFTVPGNNFGALDVLLATYARSNSSHVTFQLFFGGELLTTKTVKASSIGDNTMFTFGFDTVQDSQDKKYKLVMTSDDATAGNAITVWLNPGQFTDTAFYVDGVKQDKSMIIAPRYVLSGFDYLNLVFRRISVNQPSIVNIYTLYALLIALLFVVNSIIITLIRIVRTKEE